jgi:hypothetical protein
MRSHSVLEAPNQKKSKSTGIGRILAPAVLPQEGGTVEVRPSWADSRRRTRTLVAFGQDPSVTVKGGALLVPLEVPAERLWPGPWGARVHVIDFDATTSTLYRPPEIAPADAWAKERDTAKLVGDPGFHAQHVYAVVMATLGAFERALGRRAPFAFPGGGQYPGAAPGRGHVIKVAPHAFSDANAFYSRRDEGLFFGYFQGVTERVYSCLSHDIVAHETTHSLLDALRSRYMDPSSPDQAAFHEGFSDVVALLSVFRNREVVDAALGGDGAQIPAADLQPEALKQSALLGLAKQMGQEMAEVRGSALRRSVELRPDPGLLRSEALQEPHARGEVFVAAMMNAFVEVWVRRLRPIGLDEGRAIDRARVVEEGAEAAAHLLEMAIRAIDYAPPVDLQFSDYLSALLTADHELYPDDLRYGYRGVLRDVCASYGIEPVATTKGFEPGMWEPPERPVTLRRNHYEPLQHNPDEVFEFVWENRDALELHRDAYAYVASVRQCNRVDTDGVPLRETVAEYVQILDVRAGELLGLGLSKPAAMPAEQPVRLYGGGVLIFDEFGQLKYHVGNGVLGKRQQERLDYLWLSGFYSERAQALRRVAHMHRERAMQRRIENGDRW